MTGMTDFDETSQSHDNTGLQRCATRYDSNRSGQIQKLANVLAIAIVGIIFSKQRTIHAIIRLRRRMP